MNKSHASLTAFLSSVIIHTLGCGSSDEPGRDTSVPPAPPAMDEALPESSIITTSAAFGFDLSRLEPSLRGRLNEIKILLLTDANIESIWKLKVNAEIADVVILACSSEALSEDILDLLETWGAQGRGVLVTGSALSSRKTIVQSVCEA